MNCDSVRQTLLDHDWDESGRRQALAALTHLQECEACRSAVADYDRLRSLLREPGMPVAPAGMTEASPPRHRAYWRRSIWPALSATAAAVLIGLLGFAVGRQGGSSTAPAPMAHRADDAPAPLSSAEIEQRVRAFEEIRELFEDRAKWVLMSERASDLGLAAQALSDDSQVVVLRLRMLQAGDEVSTAELLVLAGESAELSLPLPDGRMLSYQISTSRRDPAHVSFAVAMQAAGQGERVKALATDLKLRPDRPTLAGVLGTPAGALELQVDFAKAELRGG